MIPAETVIPYPIIGSSGEEIIVKKAATVVILVKNIGTSKESMVVANACGTSPFNRISLKNFATTCTPSELAMVNRIMGIDVFIIVNKNRSDPVNLYTHPINPIIETKDNPITISTISTPGMLLKFNKRIVTIIRMPIFIKD